MYAPIHLQHKSHTEDRQNRLKVGKVRQDCSYHPRPLLEDHIYDWKHEEHSIPRMPGIAKDSCSRLSNENV